MPDHRMIETGDGLVVDPAPQPPSGSTSSTLAKIAVAKAKVQIAIAARKTLYVSRPLLNADKLIAWAKSNGFQTTQDPSDMHVTIAYSEKPVDWTGIAPNDDDVVVPAGGERSLEALGPDGAAVALLFSSPDLEERWRALRDHGAAWKWPSFRPHVTITWAGAGIDLSTIEPYQGDLEFGPESFEQIDPGWSDGRVEKSALFAVVKSWSEPPG